MSVFTELLLEARDRLRVQHRRDVGFSFDWDSTDGPESWCAWANVGRATVYRGASGEEALRRLVEALRGAQDEISG